MGWILGFCAMASLGLPGLAGFWGEFPAVLSTFNPGGNLSQPLFRTYMVVAAIGTVEEHHLRQHHRAARSLVDHAAHHCGCSLASFAILPKIAIQCW